MANRHKGEVEIILDKPRKLRYTINALAELEDKLGFSITELSENGGSGIKTLRYMVWAGLIHETPELTLEDAGTLMEYSDMETIGEKIAEAFEHLFKKSTKKN